MFVLKFGRGAPVSMCESASPPFPFPRLLLFMLFDGCVFFEGRGDGERRGGRGMGWDVGWDGGRNEERGGGR